MTTFALWILRKYKFAKFTVWVSGACMNHGNILACTSFGFVSFVPSFHLFVSNKFRSNSDFLIHNCQPFLFNPVKLIFSQNFSKTNSKQFPPESLCGIDSHSQVKGKHSVFFVLLKKLKSDRLAGG